MAYATNQLFTGPTTREGTKRVFPDCVQNKTFGPSAVASIPKGAAVAFDGSGKYCAWDRTLEDQTYRLTTTGTATGGDFIIATTGGNTSALAWNIAHGALKTALVTAIGCDAEDVEVSGGPFPAEMQIRFVGALAGAVGATDGVISIFSTSLTGTGSPTAVRQLVATGGDVSTSFETWTITTTGSPTGGAFNIAIDDVICDAGGGFPYNATAAQILTEIELAMTGADKGLVGVSCWGGPLPLPVYVQFSHRYFATTLFQPALTIDSDGLTGGTSPDPVLTRFIAGSAANRPENTFRGIAWPDDIDLDGTYDSMGQVMLSGRVHVADIVYTEADSLSTLGTELNRVARSIGFIIEGLVGFR